MTLVTSLGGRTASRRQGRTPEVTVEVFDDARNVIAEFEMNLQPTMIVDPVSERADIDIPLYAASFNLTTRYPALLDEEVVHIRVSSLTEGMLYYTMATITDNDTQHVTLVSPK